MDARSIEHPDFTISREVNGETLVLDARLDLVHQLNPTATFIWQQARSGIPTGEIAAALTEEYAVEYEAACRDVAATLARLQEVDLITGR